MNTELNSKALDFLGVVEYKLAPFEQRKQSAATSLCDVPGFEDVTNVQEQLALGGHLATGVLGTFAAVTSYMAEGAALARHKPAAILAALELTRALVAQFEVLEIALCEASAQAISEHAEALPEAERDAMIGRARQRIEAKLNALGADEDSIARLLKDLLGEGR